MKKATVVATCLVNSNMHSSLENAELAIRIIFKDEYSKQDFNQWNSNVPDRTAHNIINNVGRASRINVLNFIKDLS